MPEYRPGQRPKITPQVLMVWLGIAIVLGFLVVVVGMRAVVIP